MKKLLIALVILSLALAGCLQSPGPFTPPASCVDSDSVILEVTGGNPTGLSKAFLILQVMVIKKLDGYSAEKAREVIEEIRGLVDSSVTYATLYAHVSGKISQANNAAGATVFILSGFAQEIARIGGAKIISACDRDQLNEHLDRQEGLLAFY